MSKLSLLAGLAPVAVWMFPLQAPARTLASPPVADGPGVVVAPGAKVVERPPVVFPAGITVNGSVTVKSTVGASGEVVDARGPQAGSTPAGGAVECPQLAICAGRSPNGAKHDPVRVGLEP
jgi:hypothetical protein